MDFVIVVVVAGLVYMLCVVLTQAYATFTRPEPCTKDTPYAPPMRYSVQILRRYHGVGLIKALRETYPNMPLVVAKNMLSEGRVELIPSICVHDVTRLVNNIWTHAPEASIRIILDGTDAAFSLKEWKENHHETP